ncbi:restriction endonuclease subunit S [Luteolibacter arcticus]|uniref:Restriction endonuclease subunit S n=1 Tax=Luteolibacter arcticus TaxID=1581411 RepID=A0ABT3GC86_9BACT|nr:restriction endonuclease subunit S [Luteolibacter arcticus]MCW1921051.1 restriction endonuclease subunit S [Luteolibacter arcticus]
MNCPNLRFKDFDSDWKFVRFGDELIESKLGGNYANSEKATDHPLIKMGNLGRGEMNLRKIEYIEEGEPINPDDQIKDGDLFFNTRNTLDLVGKVAIWRSELPRAYYNSNLMRITFACNHFMNYRLNSYEGVKALRRLATGTTSVAAIYTRDLLQMRIAIPTLPEQQKIANFLTAVDGLIAQLSQKKALLEAFKKGVMQQLFNQVLRFQDDQGNDFPDWEERTLGDFCSCFSGGTPSSGKRDYYGGSIPFIRSAEIGADSTALFLTEKGLKESAAKMVEVGDLLVALYGANSGEVGISKVKGAINQAILCVRTKQSVLFLYFWLEYSKQTIVSTYLQGGQGNLSGRIVQSLDVALPSLPEQIKIANFLIALDRKIEAVAMQTAHMKTWKKGLLQQMFV